MAKQLKRPGILTREVSLPPNSPLWFVKNHGPEGQVVAVGLNGVTPGVAEHIKFMCLPDMASPPESITMVYFDGVLREDDPHFGVLEEMRFAFHLRPGEKPKFTFRNGADGIGTPGLNEKSVSVSIRLSELERLLRSAIQGRP